MPCKDGYVLIALPWDHMWQAFVSVIGNPDWAQWEIFQDSLQRGANWDALKLLLLDWTMRFTGEEIMRMTQSAGLPCFRTFTLAETVESAHERERGFFWQAPLDTDRVVEVPGSPFIFSQTPLHLRRPAPRLGEHTEEVLAQLPHLAGSAVTDGGGSRTTHFAPWGGDAVADRNGPAGTGANRLPLEGVRILDFGQIVAAPFCTQLLAWMGAEVIPVETPDRLLFRGYPPFAHGRETPNTSGMFNLLGTNKRSITLDLSTPKGLALARELVRTSDVVTENFSTGTMEKLGLGYEELRRQRPDVIMLSIGGFGSKGQTGRYAALHSGVITFSGLASVTGYPGGRPRLVGAILPDPLGGLYGCMAILEALHHRRRTGEGQRIDFSMSEVLTQLIPEAIFDYTVNGRQPKLLGNRDRVYAPQGVYRCRGWDAWVGISVSTDAEWRALCGALNQPELLDHPHFATAQDRQAHHDALDALISHWTRRRARDEAVRLLQAAGVPAGPSVTAKDLLNDPHLKARRFIRQVDHPEAGRRRMVGVPWRISGTAPVRISRAPLLGEHTEEVLQTLLGSEATRSKT